MTTDITPNFDSLQNRIGYTFKDISLLQRALTHRSFTNECDDISYNNQRLEFLGDSVLGMIIAKELFDRYPSLTEGPLSATRASLVNDTTLAEVATKLELGSYLSLGQGEINSGGRTKPSILADAFEALVGSIFLDAGIEPAKKMVLKLFKSRLDVVDPKTIAPKDYKSKLQLVVQRTHTGSFPYYEIVRKEGPQHKPTFVAQVLIDDELIAEGVGTSKKSAEQDAAKKALLSFTSDEEE